MPGEPDSAVSFRACADEEFFKSEGGVVMNWRAAKNATLTLFGFELLLVAMTVPYGYDFKDTIWWLGAFVNLIAWAALYEHFKQRMVASDKRRGS
jgi:hypothetical protein